MNFSINPLGTGAAEIGELDCSRPFTADVFRAVKRAWLDFPVLVFRDQTLSATELAAFGRRFGRLEGYETPPAGNKTAALHQTSVRETPDQMLYLSPDDPDVLVMTNEIQADRPLIGIVDNAETWHSDASHRPEPCQAIIVHVLRNPQTGGDTEFCNMYAVLDALAPEIRTQLEGCEAIHHWSKSKNPRFAHALDAAARAEGERIAQMVPEMKQPAVRMHPESGRNSLYLSPRFTLRIDGMEPDRSDALLNELFAFIEQPRFHYRHHWREKDLMIWDNRCLNHRVRSYASNDIRRRHRVTVAGDRPYYRPAVVLATGQTPV